MYIFHDPFSQSLAPAYLFTDLFGHLLPRLAGVWVCEGVRCQGRCCGVGVARVMAARWLLLWLWAAYEANDASGMAISAWRLAWREGVRVGGGGWPWESVSCMFLLFIPQCYIVADSLLSLLSVECISVLVKWLLGTHW